MINMDLTGILPAIVTPLSPDGVFLPGIFEKLIQRLYEAGVDGLYVCGQTGEGMQQSFEQRKKVLEVAIRCSPGNKLVVVHVGANSTAEAIALARHAESAGAHAISSLPPLGPYDFNEIYDYYQKLGASSGLPLLLYHHPDVAPKVTPDRALQLCEIKNVAGFKFTDFNLYLLSLLRAREVNVFNGRDEVLAAGLLMGATGGIGAFYNIFPDIFVNIYRLSRQGRFSEAATIQKTLNPVLEEIFRYPLVPAIRTVLQMVGFDCGECISPRRMLSDSEKQHLRAYLSRLPDELANSLNRAGVPRYHLG
jgi:N-acetylneuraminate lyase